MRRHLTLKEFIYRARKTHGDRYDYSTSVYNGYAEKIAIICPIHGEFTQRVNHHIEGKGCQKCGLIAQGVGRKSFCKPVFISLPILKDGASCMSIPVSNKWFAIVDEEDYPLVSLYNWSNSNGYAVSRIEGRKTRMHRFILKVEDPTVEVDHINHNTIDNRRVNIRLCSGTENRRNMKKRNGYKGVSRHRKKFMSKITVDRKQIYLGLFNTEIEAAKAYDEAAKKHHKAFAHLNFKNNQK